MKVLFIGGTGIISTACTELAATSRGIDLYLLNRGQHLVAGLPRGVTGIRGDIQKQEEVEKALAGQRWDAVVNFIAFTREDVERDIRLFSGRTGQYVFISSATVYEKPPRHYLITEETPLGNPFWDYAQHKIACEERLRDELQRNAFPATIIRPSLTYGRTLIPLVMNSWAKSWTVADRMLKGQQVVVPGDGTSLWVTTHNTDFAKGLVGLLGNPKVIGEAFHITSDEVITWDQHYQALADVLGVEPRIVHIPSDALASVEPRLRGSLLGDKARSVAFDNSKIKRFVPDFRAEVPFKEGMRRTVEWFRQDPARQVVDPDQNAMLDRLIERQRSAWGT